MAKNFLSNEERLDLIEKYKDAKFNAPPANITDKTLIENFGTDEQKARLSQPQTGEKQKGTENEAAEPAGAANEAGAEQGAADTGVNEAQNAGNSNDTVVGDGTGQALPEIPNPVTEQVSAGTANEAANVQDFDKNQEYVKEFTRYVELFTKMPNDALTAEELKAANDAKELQNAQDLKDAEQIKANAKAMQEHNSSEVTLVNKNDLNNKIVVSQYTYDKFLSKDAEWQLMPKPPVETIGH